MPYPSAPDVHGISTANATGAHGDGYGPRRGGGSYLSSCRSSCAYADNRRVHPHPFVGLVHACCDPCQYWVGRCGRYRGMGVRNLADNCCCGGRFRAFVRGCDCGGPLRGGGITLFALLLMVLLGILVGFGDGNAFSSDILFLDIHSHLPLRKLKRNERMRREQGRIRPCIFKNRKNEKKEEKKKENERPQFYFLSLSLFPSSNLFRSFPSPSTFDPPQHRPYLYGKQTSQIVRDRIVNV